MNEPEPLALAPDRSSRWLWAAGPLAVVLGMIVVLRLMGRLWVCPHEGVMLYVADVWTSSHTSQHLADSYTWSHLLHGVIFYGVAALVARLMRLPALVGRPLRISFLIALLVEAGWEILENTPWVIDHYRQNTASQDYTGDSILNSTGDLLACALGFFLARRLGWRYSLLLFVVVELVLLWRIADNLTLNVLMLLWPIEPIRQWQLSSVM
jgi:hypothetical protein